VEAGVREAIDNGLLGGHPATDVRVTLLDGSAHVNDSSELAFKIAASFAVKAACADADACLLEPVMALEVTCPEDAIGTVVGDLARRRGQVLGLAERGIRGEVPLAETFGYAGALSALTHGRGRFTLAPARYAVVM
jgi:elongation factor G